VKNKTENRLAEAKKEIKSQQVDIANALAFIKKFD
jgi:hypothetical protein